VFLFGWNVRERDVTEVEWVKQIICYFAVIFATIIFFCSLNELFSNVSKRREEIEMKISENEERSKIYAIFSRFDYVHIAM
jgi:hypothetical protein